jgi:hypothetical protein
MSDSQRNAENNLPQERRESLTAEERRESLTAEERRVIRRGAQRRFNRRARSDSQRCAEKTDIIEYISDIIASALAKLSDIFASTVE